MDDNKQKVYDILNNMDLTYMSIEHTPVYTIDNMHLLNFPEQTSIAKNLFLRDDKKQNYYLFVVNEDKRVNLKELRKNLETRPLSFASEKDLSLILKLYSGAVTPFGLINDEENKVQLYIDASFRGKRIGVHPNENTATVWLETDDLVTVLKSYGHLAEYIDL